jgi:hypothetical protein
MRQVPLTFIMIFDKSYTKLTQHQLELANVMPIILQLALRSSIILIYKESKRDINAVIISLII